MSQSKHKQKPQAANQRPISLGLGFILFVAIALTLKFATSFRPLSSQENFRSLTIRKGASASQVAQLLKENQIIRSPLALKFYLQLTHQQNRIQAGSHRLSPHLSLPQITQILTDKPEGIWITLPEGWHRQQIASKLAQVFTQNPNFSFQNFLDLTQNQEGYLFPDTYLFPANASTQLIVTTLRDTFDQKTTDLFVNPSTSLTPKQIVILASIIEREAAVDKEKPLIAGILIKRLSNSWPLQADATIQYAIASSHRFRLDSQPNWWKKTLTARDLEINSPYNTYTHPGLPPTPIANPGLASLIAAANPENSDYWFYLHDPQGQIHYAATLEQHHANIAKYLNNPD